MSQVLCKIKLDLKEYTKLIPTKKRIKDNFKTFIKSRKKGDNSRSTKQGEIIKTCRELCNSSKHPRWCKSCAILVNCILEPTYPINSTFSANDSTTTGLKQNPATKKKVLVMPASVGGRQTRRKKKKCSRRGLNP